MKNIVPAVIVVLILLGIGGYLMMNKKGVIPGGTVNNSTTQTTTSGGNVLENIRDALTKSTSFVCQYPDPTGKTKITTYVKNGAIRVKNLASTAQNTGDAIMKNNKIWIWNETKKEGMTMTMKNTNKDGTQKDQMEEAIADMEKYKNYCKVEMIADSMFTPPIDVKFQDLDAMMQGFGQQGQDGVQGLPKVTVEPTVEEVQPEE